MSSGGRTRRNRRGATLVLVAVSITALAGLGALAVDLGMLFKAQGDAQRAAEAGALAGASAFMEFPAGSFAASDTALARARRFAESNAILNKPVLASEDSVEVITASQKVRVTVERAAVETWFAKLLGDTAVLVRARAAAVAVAAGGGTCVRPFAVPDMWQENTPGQDANGDKVEDNTEDWSYTPGEDSYSPGNPDQPGAGGTGYGSELRNQPGLTNDFGRQISLRLPDPANPTPELGPQQFLPFSPTNDPNDATRYRHGLEGCDGNQVDFETSYPLMSPIPQVPLETAQVIDSLISSDNGASWDDQTNSVQGSNASDWRDSPRVIKVGLFNPKQIVPGQSAVTLNNLGQIFVESYDASTNTLTGRFFFFASGSGEISNPDSSGTLVKRLRLVE